MIKSKSAKAGDWIFVLICIVVAIICLLPGASCMDALAADDFSPVLPRLRSYVMSRLELLKKEGPRFRKNVNQNKLTEQLSEKMKEAGKTDFLIMSSGPYKHHSCMSAYCVDAQKMADAAGMLCWTDDGMVRYFSQILFHE